MARDVHGAAVGRSYQSEIGTRPNRAGPMIRPWGTPPERGSAARELPSHDPAEARRTAMASEHNRRKAAARSRSVIGTSCGDNSTPTGRTRRPVLRTARTNTSLDGAFYGLFFVACTPSYR